MLCFGHRTGKEDNEIILLLFLGMQLHTQQSNQVRIVGLNGSNKPKNQRTKTKTSQCSETS